jgi:hypothetical protein
MLLYKLTAVEAASDDAAFLILPGLHLLMYQRPVPD